MSNIDSKEMDIQEYRYIPGFSRYAISENGIIFDTKEKEFIESFTSEIYADISSPLDSDCESSHSEFPQNEGIDERSVYIFDDNNIQQCVPVKKITEEIFGDNGLNDEISCHTSVAQFSPEGKFMNIFRSVNDASYLTGINTREILKILSNKHSNEKSIWVPLNSNEPTEINFSFDTNIHQESINPFTSGEGNNSILRSNYGSRNFSIKTEVKCTIPNLFS